VSLVETRRSEAEEGQYGNLKTKYSSVHPDLIQIASRNHSLTDQLANGPGTDTVASLGSKRFLLARRATARQWKILRWCA
jgi:hypothetical protein